MTIVDTVSSRPRLSEANHLYGVRVLAGLTLEQAGAVLGLTAEVVAGLELGRYRFISVHEFLRASNLLFVAGLGGL